MTPKAKKAAMISGIVAGSVVTIGLLAIIPIAIKSRSTDTGKTDKNKELEDKYIKAEQDVIKANTEYKKLLDEKSKDLANLQAEYDAIDDKKTPSAQAKFEKMDNLLQEVNKLKENYERVINEAIYEPLRDIAKNGNAKEYPAILKYTAKYIVLAYRKYKKDQFEFGKQIDLKYPKKEKSCRNC
ncbi:hypothetical protein [Mycoplasmopsis arginini]|uniref:hypothetical protein n=1 Tax=Mycoplasmopsis arginini TaxID=2094 RepID=UPI003D03EDC4